MSNPWFRFYSEFYGNPVAQSLAFEDQRHFVVLLCMKCDGTLDRPMDAKIRDRIICRGLGLDPVTASEVKRRLMEVSFVDASWQPTGWSARQFLSDNSTDRVRKYRKNKETGNVTSAFLKRRGNAPDTDTDTDTDTETRKGKATQQRFVPPTLDEVRDHIREKGYAFTAEQFVAHYEANGWMRGRTKIKNWKACCVTWNERRSSASEPPAPTRTRKPLGAVLESIP